jgi:hypothetical protein
VYFDINGSHSYQYYLLGVTSIFIVIAYFKYHVWSEYRYNAEADKLHNGIRGSNECERLEIKVERYDWDRSNVLSSNKKGVVKLVDGVPVAVEPKFMQRVKRQEFRSSSSWWDIVYQARVKFPYAEDNVATKRSIALYVGQLCDKKLSLRHRDIATYTKWVVHQVIHCTEGDDLLEGAKLELEKETSSTWPLNHY